VTTTVELAHGWRMSMLADLKARALAAMKAKDLVATTILRLAASEIQMIETRTSAPATADEAAQVLRKLIKSNEETLGTTTDEGARAVLLRENDLLREVLPKALSVDEIIALLAPVAAAIVAAAATGPATGIAVKHLKSIGRDLPGAEVTRAVTQLRTA
jgi:uncharacterized protein YqeY